MDTTFYLNAARGLAVALCVATVSLARASMLPPLAQRIELPGVEGRIDHMAIDVSGHRLFVAALGNNSVEVIDLDSGKVIRSITGVDEPQGVAFDLAANRIAVTCGGSGTCRFYHAHTYELLRTAKVGPDADNLRLDSAANRLYLGCGEGQIKSLNATNGAAVLGGAIDLPEHPESFQLETAGTRIFVNLPQRGSVGMLDRARDSLVTTWSLGEARANFPMALDEADHRLFIGCRNPAQLVVMNTDQGEIVATLPCVGDADDVFYDETRHRVYVSGGAGRLDVFRVRDANDYVLEGSVNTAPGARTCLFSAERNALYLAVPHRGNQPAEIWVYDLLAK